MASDFININPLDIDKNVAIGISLPFNNNTGFNLTYTTKEQLKSNILNLFLTRPGERIFQPTFGIDLKIFENITDDYSDVLISNIKDTMLYFFPNVVINNLQISTSPDYNLVKISLSYSIPNMNISDNLNIQFQT